MSSGVSSWVTNGLEGAQVGSVPVVFWTARRPGCSLPSYVSAKLLLPGRVGIVVPNGYLGNRSPRYASFREWLLRNTRIVSIISLPRFTFKKSGADVSASLLFLEKRPRPLARLTTAGKYEFHVGMITSVGWTVVKRPERVWARDPETGAVLVDANNEPVQ